MSPLLNGKWQPQAVLLARYPLAVCEDFDQMGVFSPFFRVVMILLNYPDHLKDYGTPQGSGKIARHISNNLADIRQIPGVLL